MAREYFVYTIENTVNNRKYIGYTDFNPTVITPVELYAYSISTKEAVHLTNSMEYYGFDMFTINMVAFYKDEHTAKLHSNKLIESCNTLSPENGYQQNFNLIPSRADLPEWLATNVELTERMRKVDEIAKVEILSENMIEPILTPSKASDNPYDLIITTTKLLKEMQQAYLRDDYSTVMDIYKDFSQYVEVDKKLDDIICDLLIDAKDEIINLMDNLEF